jgi:hypothetical protein
LAASLVQPDNAAPARKGRKVKTSDEPDTVPLSAIGCKTQLGGLLKHYYRKAA